MVALRRWRITGTATALGASSWRRQGWGRRRHWQQPRLRAPSPRTGRAWDFNGDGFDDVAIGIPGEDVGAATNSGVVEVRFGTGSETPFDGPVAAIRLASAQPGAKLGASLLTAELNGDYCTDLVLGASG